MGNCSLRPNQPVPTSFTPPMDPPTIALNKRQRIKLHGVVVFGLTVSPKLTTADVKSLLLAATGGTGENFSFYYHKVSCYAPIVTPGNPNVTLTLTDSPSNLSTTDVGTLVNRARCGFSYSPAAQRIYSTSTASFTLFELEESPLGTATQSQGDVYLDLTFWKEL